VEVETEPGAEGLFDEKATPTLESIKSDVTRHRYGDDAHLDSSLKTLGLSVPQGRYPQLKKVIESRSPDGELQFTMLFESKDVPFTTWSDPMKIVAGDRFFGPGVWTKIWKYSSEKRMAALMLTTGPKPAISTDADTPAKAASENKVSRSAWSAEGQPGMLQAFTSHSLSKPNCLAGASAASARPEANARKCWAKSGH